MVCFFLLIQYRVQAFNKGTSLVFLTVTQFKMPPADLGKCLSPGTGFGRMCSQLAQIRGKREESTGNASYICFSSRLRDVLGLKGDT